MAKEASVKIIVVPVRGEAKAIVVNNTVDSFRNLLGGFMEALPTEFDHNGRRFIYLCNECGKIDGMTPCRAVYIMNGIPKDIIFGDFVITTADEEGRWVSLTDEECAFIIKEMANPTRSPWRYMDMLFAAGYRN